MASARGGRDATRWCATSSPSRRAQLGLATTPGRIRPGPATVFCDDLPGTVGAMDGPQSSDPGGPPQDPESWTDEQWIAWLDATDDPDASDDDGSARPRHWSRGRSA